MTKTESRRRKVAMPFDIRKKFAAAICMLLIAAIMMISSSYAWFTLSTAPEVTGITTSIGANGNLEIALLNKDSFISSASDLGIISNVGDSMETTNKSKTEANVTWGNLVDLSDVSYGLGNVILNPAALNITNPTATNTAYTLGNAMLKAPSYGSDGRVIKVDKDTTTGKWNSGNSAFIVSDYSENAGVRAIGDSAGITLRMSSYRNAVAGLSTNITSMKNAARGSLVDNGDDLGLVLVKVAAKSGQTDSITFSKADVLVFKAVLDDLSEANSFAAVAIRNAVKAVKLGASNTDNLSDDEVSTLLTNIDNTAIDELGTTFFGENVPAWLTSAITHYNTVNTEIANVTGSYDALNVDTAGEDDTFTYTQVSPLIDGLINTEYVTVAGYSVSDESARSQIISAVLSSNEPIAIVMNAGSGIYYDIAVLAGNYTASPLEVTVVPSELGLGDGLTSSMTDPITLTASMSTAATSTADLENALSAANSAGTPQSSTGGATSLDDTYGYALDFGFRTNASSAKLLLQQNGIQRVYNTENKVSDNSLTQGAGSYMQFKSTNIATFGLDDVKALMSAIRIVFAIPTVDTASNTVSYEIIAVAAPQITVTYNNNGTRTVEGGTASASVANGENDTITSVLALYNFTVEEIADTNHEVKVTLTTKKTTGEGENAADDVVLTTLEQNIAKKITAIVYLDGDVVDNTMVANAKTSMTGTLNLQFATDADLVPMDNSALFNGTNSNTQTPSVTITKTKLLSAIDAVKAMTAYTSETGESRPLHDAVTTAQAACTAAATDDADVTEAANAFATACNAVLSNSDKAALATALGITLP